jgi:NADH pyrophosphatase NudC (nudix superfamily)
MSDARYCLRCGAELSTIQAERPRLGCTCGYVFYDNPTPVVAALVEHDGAILLVRQHGWPEKWYGLVTGFLERGETPEQGVLRELEEELSVSGTIESLIGVYAFEQRNELIVAYHVLAEGEVRLGAELEAFKRVAKEKLRAWPFGTGHAVRDWLARRSGRAQR